jgi:ABC-type glycerol-3-phosphate transport system substrate-binding protein
MRKSLAFLFFVISSIVTVNVLSAQAGGRLTVWSFTDEIGGIITNYFRNDNRAIQVNYLYTPTEQFEHKLDPVLASGQGAPDVIALESAFVRKYVESGLLMDLTDIYEANRDRLLAYPVEVGTYAGRVYALSWQACPGAMFYRRSMARKYLGTDDPRTVQTFFSDIEKMMETAALLKKRSDGSCVLTSSRGELFIPFLYARRSPWVVNGRLVIDPVMEQYMDNCKTLFDSRMEGRVGQWSEGWFAGMRDELVDINGKLYEVFAYFLPTWGLHYVLKTNAANTSGDWAMIQGPVPYRWGGTWIGAYRNAQNPDAARELIRYITANDSFLERYARDSGDFVTSLPAIQRIQNNFREPFLAGQNHYAAFAEIARNINGSLAQANDSVIESIFLEEVEAYVYYGEKTKAQALADFRRRVQRELGLQ